jgi:uncharacterized protein (TIGR02996 family)
MDELLDLLTHPEAATFLRAVRAAPADDTTRLVFADWLDEHGAPDFARWVRTQCLAPDSDDEAAQWQDRWADEFRAAFAGLHAPPRYESPESMGVRRGFVETAVCATAEWGEHGPALVRHPLAVVRDVRLSNARPDSVNGEFYWYSTTGYAWGGLLPEGLWHVLANEGAAAPLAPDPDLPIVGLAYPTEAEAQAALTRGALRFAWAAGDPPAPAGAPADSAHGFHQLLDAAPADHALRGAFADWLAARGDPRGGGFRALADTRRAPSPRGGGWVWDWNRFPAWERKMRLPPRDPDDVDSDGMTRHCLPQPWFEHLGADTFPTRRAAEWAAIRAWFALPTGTRNDVLNAAGV